MRESWQLPMSIYKIEETKRIEKLFENWEETMICSCLQGCMGGAWADNDLQPESAQIVIADFCFFAGKPNLELVLHKPEVYKSDFTIMVPQTNEWGALIEKAYQERSKKVTRYAIKKEPDAFEIEKLREIVNGVSEPFQIQLMNKNSYDQVIHNHWSRDLCLHFINYDNYKKYGLGAAITDNGIVVSGASSYTAYKEGIEIEIDTREDYRRKGLALACGAALILECLERGLYPSWDAQNKGSVALAEKLGYHFDKEYDAYEINGY